MLHGVAGQRIRFAGTSLIAGGLDFSVVLLVASYIQSHSVSVLCGWLAGCSVGYYMHEFWTFRSGIAKASLHRFVKFYMANASLLFFRQLAIWILPVIMPDAIDDRIFLFMIFCISFCLNYIITTIVVFKKKC